ncbi:MAG: FkbM family methyltransferase [Caldilineaceae bacterium]
MLTKQVTFIHRKLKARQLGVSFSRTTTFRPPTQVKIQGKAQTVSLPADHGTAVAFRDLLLDDCYGLKTCAKPIARVLDIGAHVGLFGLALRNFFPNALLHAYEPNPKLEQYLRAQAQTAHFDYFMEAVGLEDGKVTLAIDDNSVWTQSKVDPTGNVPQVAFRRALERLGGSADLVKLDCEGAEWQILQDEQAWQKVYNLSMEYHLWPNHTHDEIQATVQRLGFSIKKVVPVRNKYGLLLAERKG